MKKCFGILFFCNIYSNEFEEGPFIFFQQVDGKIEEGPSGTGATDPLFLCNGTEVIEKIKGFGLWT